MDNYEISLWEDYQVTSDGGSYFDERKLCVIGSDSMTALARAIEPTLTENINGTHTFTFKMFYTYTDTITGEKYENPFSKLLTNERKVKVKWKNKWYDFVIKNIDEDSAGKSATYTCTDLFINELSKNGYNLTFDTELENNIGTAGELVQKVLENTTWRYDTNSDQLVLKIKEAVYKRSTLNEFMAGKLKSSSLNEFSNYKYRCLVTYENSETSFVSNEVLLIIKDDATKILRHPKNVECSIGETVYFSVEAARKVQTYNWLYCLANSSTWKTSGAVGLGTNKISLEGTSSRNGLMYRCKITFTDGTTATSNSAKMVIPNLQYQITVLPLNLIIDENNSAVFTIKTVGEKPIYLWLYKTSESSEWIDSIADGLGTNLLIVNLDIPSLIPPGKDILVYYSQISKLLDMKNNEIREAECLFLYSAEPYKTEYNDMLVVNGDCYVAKFNWRRSGDQFTASINNLDIITIDLANGVSNEYLAERLIKSLVSEYDLLLERFVNLYKDSDGNDIYGLLTIEYSDPLIVINLIVNPNNFVNTLGWIPATGVEAPIFKAWPEYNSQTSIGSYIAKSYLKLYTGNIDNTLFESNIGYFTPNSADIKNGDIKGILIGDKYILRFKAIENRNDSSGKSIDPSGLDYIQVSGKIIPSIVSGNNLYFDIGTPEWNETGKWLEYTLTCKKSCPVNDIKNLKLRLNLTSICWIENIEFFKYIEGAPSCDSNDRVRIDPGQVDLSSIANTYYKYYPKDHAGAQKIEDLVYLYSSTDDTDLYTPVYNNYEKINTISIKESNRFNILLEIAEIFLCWIYFNIEHDETGKILIDEDGLPEKYVRIVKEIGDRTGFCFEYGIDLKSISRQVNSDSIATKVIIPSNTNEFGKNGFCSIARSRENYSKENFIINLEYYTNLGIIDRELILRDLYSKDDDHYIGYYYHLHELNELYDTNTEILALKQLELVKQLSLLIVYDLYVKATILLISSNEADMCELAGVDTFEQANQYAKDHANNDKIQALMNAHAQAKLKKGEYESLLGNINTAISGLEDYIASLKLNQKNYLEDLNELHNTFNKKYANYLFEGTWKDDSFVDDDKYYLAGLEVAYTSSRPQVLYTFDVLRLSSLEEFSSKIFNLGDICYVQDREFFGYVDEFTPYKEEVLISELISYFDTPEKDVIKVLNYRTQFDDLFSRITAATQSLEYSQGQFTRAAEQINPDNTLLFDLLLDTFDKNKNLVLSASNQNVAWDNTGITVTDSVNVGNKLRVMAGGVFVTNDGGNTWKNAIRGDGISTDLLTAGRINTSDIYVYDGSSPAFRWDNKGIIAYSHNNSTPDFSKYVRFSDFGIYGYSANEEVIHETELLIWDDENCKFGLTWKGFFLRGGAASGTKLEIKSDDNQYIKLNSKPANWDEDYNKYYIKDLNDNFILNTNPVYSSGIEYYERGKIDFTLSGSSGNSSLSMSASNSSATFNLMSANGNNSIEISTEHDILVKTDGEDRIKIGRLDALGTDYGILIKDSLGANIFSVNSNPNLKDIIGGWNLTSNSFEYNDTTYKVGLYPLGVTDYFKLADSSTETINNTVIRSGLTTAGTFLVTKDGKLYSNAGKIAGWTINSDSLTNSTIKISGGEISCTLPNDDDPSWYIKNDGTASFSKATIEGKVTITDGGLYLGKPAGLSYYNASIDENGLAKFYDIQISNPESTIFIGRDHGDTILLTTVLQCSGGTIGGWTIGTGSLYAGSSSNPTILLSPNGSIQISGTTLTGHTGGGLTIGGSTYISGSLYTYGVGTKIESQELSTPKLSLYKDNPGDGISLNAELLINLEKLIPLSGKLSVDSAGAVKSSASLNVTGGMTATGNISLTGSNSHLSINNKLLTSTDIDDLHNLQSTWGNSEPNDFVSKGSYSISMVDSDGGSVTFTGNDIQSMQEVNKNWVLKKPDDFLSSTDSRINNWDTLYNTWNVYNPTSFVTKNSTEIPMKDGSDSVTLSGSDVASLHTMLTNDVDSFLKTEVSTLRSWVSGGSGAGPIAVFG